MIARLALLLALAALPAAAQDYAREKRWADEVVPALVVGDAVWLETLVGPQVPRHPRAGGEAEGRGRHRARHWACIPIIGVIGVLRTKLTDLGWTTLSIQMPVQASDARSEAYYPALFPEAIERIARAGAWLAGRGEKKTALVSHSMGSWMANEYFDATPDSPFAAWVCLGLTGGYSLSTWFSPRPILDVYGEKRPRNVARRRVAPRLTLASAPDGSRQVMIAGADHFYAGREEELARERSTPGSSSVLR